MRRMLARLVTADGCSKIVTTEVPRPPRYVTAITKRLSMSAFASFEDLAVEPTVMQREYEFWGYDEAWDGVEAQPCAVYREKIP